MKLSYDESFLQFTSNKGYYDYLPSFILSHNFVSDNFSNHLFHGVIMQKTKAKEKKFFFQEIDILITIIGFFIFNTVFALAIIGGIQ